MSERISIRQWQQKYKNGDFDGTDRMTMTEAGWYDWFCLDSSLPNRLKKMARIVTKIADGGKVNLDTSYVWFKNNCPMVGGTYDDFRIADLETQKNLIVVSFPDNRKSHRSEHSISDLRSGDIEMDVVTGDEKTMIEWLNTPDEE